MLGSASWNAVISPNFLEWKFCGNAQFPKIHPKLCGNCVFPQNFHTRKLGKDSYFTQWWRKPKALKLSFIFNVFTAFKFLKFYFSKLKCIFLNFAKLIYFIKVISKIYDYVIIPLNLWCIIWQFRVFRTIWLHLL